MVPYKPKTRIADTSRVTGTFLSDGTGAILRAYQLLRPPRLLALPLIASAAGKMAILSINVDSNAAVSIEESE